MKIQELAVLYRESASALQQRLRELRAMDGPELSFEAWDRLWRRIHTLESMYRDMRETVAYLERYYAGGEKHEER